MARTALSRPMTLAFEEGVISSHTSVFDYGCGRGDDVRTLQRIGIRASGWDPVHQASAAVKPADVVNLGYVINVIEEVSERREVLRRAWNLAQRALVVAA